MGKRILAMVLSCALLLTCISGLTLIAGAADTVKAFDGQPNAFQDGKMLGSFEGFDVFQWKDAYTGWMSWNNNKIANAMGLEGSESGTALTTLELKFDYYWAKGETGSDNNWIQVKTLDSAGNTIAGDGFGTLGGDVYNMTPNAWNELVVTRENAVIGKNGKDDLNLNVGDMSNSSLYVRGLSVKATDGEGNNYTVLWGSYTHATIDFTSGEAVGFNAAIAGTPSTSIEADGMKMTTHNQGFNFTVANLGLADGDMAVTVEYLMQSEHVGDNTRFNVSFGGKNHVMRVGKFTGADVVNTDTNLVKDTAATYTFIVTGDEAAALRNGTQINTMLWNDFDGNYYFIKSITICPASQIATVPDPGYEYYDFAKTFVANPYYSDYGVADKYGEGYFLNGGEGIGQVTEDGLVMDNEKGTVYFTTTNAKETANVGLKFYFAEGTEDGTFGMNYQSDTDNWTGLNPEIKDGVATVVLENAKFTNGANGGSFRIHIGGKTLVRAEIYVAADKAALKDAIDNKITDFTGKTDASKAAYEKLAEEAQAVYDNTFATQAQVNTAKDNLTNAVLKDIPTVDFTGKTFAYKDCDVIGGTVVDEGANFGFTDQGEYFDYEVNVAEAGVYSIAVEMTTGNADSTVAICDGEGNEYGTVVVPNKGWGSYEKYEIKAALKAGVQTIRVLYKVSSANFKSLTIGDGRYTLTNATWLPNWTDATNPHYGKIVTKDGSYAFYVGHAKGIAIGDANHVLDDVAKVTIELNYWVETNEAYTGDTTKIAPANRRTLPSYATVWEDNGTPKNDKTIGTFNMSALEGGKWATKTWQVEDANFKDAGIWSGADIRAMFYDEGCNFDEEKGGFYIRSFKAYATEDPTKVVSIDFTQLADMTELQAAIDEEITDLTAYTDKTAEAYTNAMNAAKAIKDNQFATQAQVDAAKNALLAAKDALLLKADEKFYSEISFEGDTINTVNGNINHNHPNEDDADADNGIYEVATDTYGIKMSKQNRGFGYHVDNTGAWLAAETPVRIVVSYFAPSDAAQDNSRLGIQFDGDSWYRIRVGESADFVVSGLTKDAVDSFAIELSAADAAKVAASGNINFFFWNYNDDAATGGDCVYITAVRIEAMPDYSELQAAVDNAKTDLSAYSKDSADAYTAALDAANAVLANKAATQTAVDEAKAALETADANLVIPYSELNFANDQINGVNAGINHNHPDEDDGADDNGIYEVAEGVYGIKMSKQNRGFGFKLTNNSWIKAGDKLQLVVSYYAPTENVQDNSRLGFNLPGDVWYRVRVGEDAGMAVSGLTKDAVSTFTINLSDADCTALMAAEASFNVYFWNYNDNPDTGADFLYLTMVRVEKVPETTVREDLQEKVDHPVTDLMNYTTATAEAYTAALEAAKEVLKKTDATDAELQTAFDSLKTAEDGLVDLGPWNLVVTEVGIEGGDDCDGEKVNFYMIIKNIGEKTIPENSKYGGIFKIGDTMVGWSDNYKKGESPALATNDTLKLVSCGGGANSDGTWTAKAGAYKLTAQVNDNPGDGIKDEDGTDNILTRDLTVTEATFDLVVESVTTTAGNNVKVGESVKFVAVVKNVGRGSLAAGSPLGVAFSVDGATVAWSDNYKTGNADEGKLVELKPGETVTLTSCGGPENGDGTWKAAEAKDYVVEAFVNDNGITEANKENNKKSENITATALNIEALRTAIAEAKTVDLTKYEKASGDAFAAAIKTAEDVLAKKDATQKEIDDQVTALDTAKKALVLLTKTLLGDVDGDGKITTTDARMVLQLTAEKIKEADIKDLVAAEVDGQTGISTTDARLILQHAAEKITTFPIEEVK